MKILHTFQPLALMEQSYFTAPSSSTPNLFYQMGSEFLNPAAQGQEFTSQKPLKKPKKLLNSNSKDTIQLFFNVLLKSSTRSSIMRIVNVLLVIKPQIGSNIARICQTLHFILLGPIISNFRKCASKIPKPSALFAPILCDRSQLLLIYLIVLPKVNANIACL